MTSACEEGAFYGRLGDTPSDTPWESPSRDRRRPWKYIALVCCGVALCAVAACMAVRSGSVSSASSLEDVESVRDSEAEPDSLVLANLTMSATNLAATQVVMWGGDMVRDLAQGQLGDCYLLAALVAIAETHPDRIQAMFVERDTWRQGIFKTKWLP
mmetsp:Transcript_47120/g.102515  ORF Transcript_47120/g.102515 Transcript_47120/m.102515 type:complete len:157 (-) Transcript_47120:38-508(-)